MSTSSAPQGSFQGNMALAGLAVLAAIIFAIGAIFYWTQSTSLFAGSLGIHHKHALISAVLAVVSLVAANLLRPKSV